MRTRTRLLCLAVVAGAVCVRPVAIADPPTNETSRVLDGCGGWSSNVTYTLVSAACQPGPVGLTVAPTFRNHSGFLGTFLLHPDMDLDGDGKPDENDPDDDGDGLTDGSELAGADFDPATVTDPLVADSDRDGAGDGAEAAAGTDPLNRESYLRITRISGTGDGRVTVHWQSRDGRTYDLVAASNAAELASLPGIEAKVTAAGGVAPWYVTESVATSAPPAPRTLYRVHLTQGSD